MTDVQSKAGEWLGLAGARVLVAGAGGIGSAVAAAFASLGAHIAIVDGDAARVCASVDEIGLKGDGSRFHGDLRDGDTCRRVVTEARAALGRLDVLVHAIGINQRIPILEFTDADWQAMLDVNLSSAFYLGQAAGGVMCEQGNGRIVYLSSVAGLLAHRHHGPYAATKGGINQLMRVMAAEWASSNVTVNAVAPGYVETPLTSAYLEKPGIRSGLESLVPAGRLGTVEDVANAAVFLASKRASFITGHVLYVDGGRTLV